MHEAAIAESLYEQVKACVPEGSTLTSVHIDIGELEHLDASVLDAAWTGMTMDTPFAGVPLGITWTPLKVRCRACGHEYVPEDKAIMICPQCDAAQPAIVQGSGVILKSLEVDQHV